MKRNVDVLVSNMGYQIGGAALFDCPSGVLDSLALLVDSCEGNIFFSDFDLADKNELKSVTREQLLSLSQMSQIINNNGCRIDFVHKDFGWLVLSIKVLEDDIIKLRFHLSLDIEDQVLNAFLTAVANTNCRQIYLSHDIDIWSQNCSDPSLFEACDISIPNTATVTELKLGNKVIRQLDVSTNPGFEKFDNSFKCLRVAGWWNLFRLDVIASILNCQENEITERMKSILNQNVDVVVLGLFVSIKIKYPIEAISTKLGRDYQKDFLRMMQ